MSHAHYALRRAPFVLAAIAMTALTLGLTVVMPAQLDSGYAASRVVAQRPLDVAAGCPCRDAASTEAAVWRAPVADGGCRQSI